jgi:hypothetical protein
MLSNNRCKEALNIDWLFGTVDHQLLYIIIIATNRSTNSIQANHLITPKQCPNVLMQLLPLNSTMSWGRCPLMWSIIMTGGSWVSGIIFLDQWTKGIIVLLSLYL